MNFKKKGVAGFKLKILKHKLFIIKAFCGAFLCFVSACAPHVDNAFFVTGLGKLKVGKTVWRPLVAQNPCTAIVMHRLANRSQILDIGTGTGVLALLAVANGAQNVVGTDINPEAIQIAQENAILTGLNKKVEFRLVSPDNPGAYSVIGNAERFDVIITNPPFNSKKPQKIEDYARRDEKFQFLESIFLGARSHLTENGLIYMYQGKEEGIRKTFELAKKHDLNAKIICPFEKSFFDSELKALTSESKYVVLFEISLRKRHQTHR